MEDEGKARPSFPVVYSSVNESVPVESSPLQKNLPIWPSIYILRHGEGTHNEANNARAEGVPSNTIFNNLRHFDAELTQRGVGQALRAADHMPPEVADALAASRRAYSQGLRKGLSPAELQLAADSHLIVLTSPLRRTLKTTLTALPGVISVHALEDVREWGGASVCDARHTLREAFTQFSPLLPFLTVEGESEIDPREVCRKESKDFGENRCRRVIHRIESLCLRAINQGASGAAREEGVKVPVVVIVGHQAWARLFQSLYNLVPPEKRGIKNCEWRLLHQGGKQAIKEAPKPQHLSAVDPPLPLEVTLDRSFLHSTLQHPHVDTVMVWPPCAPEQIEDEPRRLMADKLKRILDSSTVPPHSSRSSEETAPRLLDGRSCLRRIEGGQMAVEIVQKERLHNLNLLLVVVALPSSASGEERAQEAWDVHKVVRQLYDAGAHSVHVVRVRQ